MLPMASPIPPASSPDPESIAERLKQQSGARIDPTPSLDPAATPDRDKPGSLIDKLRGAGTRGTRYRLLGEVGRGGMGVILKIWDDELRRTLAMKVVLGQGDKAKGDTPQIDPKTLGRFLEEAQVTGQLDHPGIVPVHELGLGADGRVYFTMRLVKGEDLRSVFEKVRAGKDGWNEVRALGVLLKVCEAMSYAHSKKVVHRDLKPANVMVGKFGEVYVMDWGLARVLGRDDMHDLRIQPQSMAPSVVRTERNEKREETPDSPLVTMDGDVVGTPSYMPPEQARGQLDKLGPHSDVYSLGAMLYQLLTGEMPYAPRGALISQLDVLMRVMKGPPRPIRQLARRARGDLIAVCEKAMERDIHRRYRDMGELAADLQAFLEGGRVGARSKLRRERVMAWWNRQSLPTRIGLFLLYGLHSLLALISFSIFGFSIPDETTPGLTAFNWLFGLSIGIGLIALLGGLFVRNRPKRPAALGLLAFALLSGLFIGVVYVAMFSDNNSLRTAARDALAAGDNQSAIEQVNSIPTKDQLKSDQVLLVRALYRSGRFDEALAIVRGGRSWGRWWQRGFNLAGWEALILLEQGNVGEARNRLAADVSP